MNPCDQAQRQALKKSVGTGDKKKKKEVLESIAKLEDELNTRHKTELEEFDKTGPGPDDNRFILNLFKVEFELLYEYCFCSSLLQVISKMNLS